MKKNNKETSVFDKANQKILAERYREGLIPVWKGDEHMINWCVKHVALFVPICNGKYILSIDKCGIEKDFCFGYSSCGQGPTFEENNKNMENVRANLIKYFLDKNLAPINNMIESLEDILNDKSCTRIMHHVHYYSAPDDSPVHDFGLYRYYDIPTDGSIPMEKEDIQILLDGYKIFKQMFEKKLETYVKKYDLRKVRVRSYWIDE